MTSRRNFLLGLGAALAAPAIIRTPGLLMPVRKVITDTPTLMLQALDRLSGNWIDVAQVLDSDHPFVDAFGDMSRAMVNHKAYSASRNRFVANKRAQAMLVHQFDEVSLAPFNLGPAETFPPFVYRGLDVVRA